LDQVFFTEISEILPKKPVFLVPSKNSDIVYNNSIVFEFKSDFTFNKLRILIFHVLSCGLVARYPGAIHLALRARLSL
jgi:hypothetical protein